MRLVDVPADAGKGLGLFQTLHGHTSAAALAEALRAAARAQHGTPSRTFLARLAQDRANNETELREVVAALRNRFMAEYVPACASGQVSSVAGRFALIAAAGELARDYGVLPWPEGEAMRAAGACFAAWLAQRDGAGPAEETAAMAQARGFFEANGEARFTPLLPLRDHDGNPIGDEVIAPEQSRTINRAGYRRPVGDGWEYLVLPEAWKAEVCRGHNATWVADLLAKRGLLVLGKNGKRAVSVTIRGEGKRRVYRVSGAILADDGAEGGPDGAR